MMCIHTIRFVGTHSLSISFVSKHFLLHFQVDSTIHILTSGATSIILIRHYRKNTQTYKVSVLQFVVKRKIFLGRQRLFLLPITSSLKPLTILFLGYLPLKSLSKYLLKAWHHGTIGLAVIGNGIILILLLSFSVFQYGEIRLVDLPSHCCV